MIVLMFLASLSFIISKVQNETLFFSHQDQVFLNLDPYKGRELKFFMDDQNSQMTRNHTQNQPKMIHINSSLFENIITCPLFKDYKNLEGLTKTGEMIFLNEDLVIKNQTSLLKDGIEECFDVSQFQLEQSEGSLVLCRTKEDFTFVQISCDNQYVFTQQEIVSQNITLKPSQCKSPKIISQIDVYPRGQLWLSIYCADSDVVQLLVAYYSEPDKIMINDFGSLSEYDKSLNFGNIKKVIFTSDSTLAILDMDQGLVIIEFDYDGICINLMLIIEFNCYRVGQITFLEASNEKFLTMEFSLEQSSASILPLEIDSRYISKSLIVISDFFLYEIAIPPDQNVQLQIVIHDKLNLRQRFLTSNDTDVTIQSAQLVYDNHYYYLCLNIVDMEENSNQCKRLTRHFNNSNKEETQQLMFTNRGQAILLLGVNNPNAVSSYNTTKLLLFFLNGTKVTARIYENQQNILRLQSNVNENFTNVLIVNDYNNNQNYSYLIKNDKRDIPTLYVMPEPPIYLFINIQGSLYLSDFVRGPDIRAKIIDLVDQSQEVVYNSSFVQATSFSLYELYDDTILDSIYIQSFLTDNTTITIVQHQNYSICFIYFIKGLSGSGNYSIYTHEIEPIQLQINRIVAVGNNFLIQFQNITDPYFLVISPILKVDALTRKITFKVSLQAKIFENSEPIESFELLNNVLFYNIFVVLNYVDGSQSIVYQSILSTDNMTYTIILDKKYRNFDLKFLQQGLLLASFEENLYFLQLYKKEFTRFFESKPQQIKFRETFEDDFTFGVVDNHYLNYQNPRLVIVDKEIYLYQLDDLRNYLDLLAVLPRFNHSIFVKQFTLNQAMLIVTLKKDYQLFYFVYDLIETGQDRLYKSLLLFPNLYGMGILQMTSITTNKYKFCIWQDYFINRKFFVYCFIPKKIKVELQQIANDQNHTNFNMNLILNSYQQRDLQQINCIMSGSFYFQETVINKNQFEKNQEIILIFKTKEHIFQPQKYFNGPVMNYQLQGNNSKNLSLQTFVYFIKTFQIAERQNASYIDDQQNITGVILNEDFLVTIGDIHVSVKRVTFNQGLLNNVTKITYESLSSTLQSRNKTPIDGCVKVFLQPLTKGLLARSYILTLVCTNEKSNVNDDVINQLIFVILSDDLNVTQAFQQRIFFPLFLTKDSSLTSGLNFISAIDLVMLNYALNQTSFFSISAAVIQNLRYVTFTTDNDDVIAILFGFFNPFTNVDVVTVRLIEIGAQDFGLDRLTVNGLQLICLENCEDPTTPNGLIKFVIFFNDLTNCTLYYVNVQITYDLLNINSSVFEILSWNSMDIKQQVLIKSYNQLNLLFVQTKVQVQEDSLVVQVTTNSVAFDFTTDLKLQTIKTIDTVFRQYTDCPNPKGSLHSSNSEYLAISCKNNSQFALEQLTYIKLFIRDKTNQTNLQSSKIQINNLTSVVEAIKISGSLEYVDVRQILNTDDFYLTTLERYVDNQSTLILSNHILSRTLKMTLNDGSPQKMLDVSLCASNLHKSSGQVCTILRVSNIGDGQFIETELVNFFFLVFLPLLITIMTLLFGVIIYKTDKNKRIQLFRQHQKNHQRINESIPLTDRKNDSTIISS